MKNVLAFATVVVLQLFSSPCLSQDYFDPAGELEPGSGTGRKDNRVYFPDLRFPLEQGSAFLNSQVYRPGGSNGPPGGQCAAVQGNRVWPKCLLTD